MIGGWRGQIARLVRNLSAAWATKRLTSTTFLSFLTALWPLLLPLAWVGAGINSFPYPAADARYSDFTITHYPNALYLQRSLWQWHALPLWAPNILSGFPFVAHPLSGFWYPPIWLACLLPLPFGLNLVLILHLAWSGWGMYRWLQGEGLGIVSALAGALAWQAWPKVYAHLGAGHQTLLFAVSWTPWLLRAAQLRLQGRKAAAGWGEAVVLALVFLADVRWVIFAGLTWLGYLLWRQIASAWGGKGKVAATTAAVLQALPQILLAALLAAPLALPLMEFTRLSSRSALTAEDALIFSLPPGRLLGLVFPDFAGFHEFQVYPGAIILLLAVLAVLGIRPARLAGSLMGFALALGLTATLFALGGLLPGFSWLMRLPGLDLLRVPSRALFLDGLAAAALAALGVEGLLALTKGSAFSAQALRRARLGLITLMAFALMLAVVLQGLQGQVLWPFAWGAGVILLGTIWLLMILAGRLPAGVGLLGLALLATSDLTAVNRSLFSFQPAQQVFSEGQELAEYLSAQPGLFRVYSPSYSLPQQTAARYRLQSADGIDPLQLQAYVDLMEFASGIPISGYSVTLPPFASGNPQHDNAGYSPFAPALGWLNVRYVAAEFDLTADGLQLVRRFGDTRLYQNRQALPRAWIQPESMLPGQQYRPVQRLEWRPGWVKIQTTGPGLVVLAEVAYPGWRAWVNGKPAEILPVAGALMGVVVAAGTQQIEFAFLPFSPVIGLLLALLGIGILLAGKWSWMLRSG